MNPHKSNYKTIFKNSYNQCIGFVYFLDSMLMKSFFIKRLLFFEK